MSKKKIQIFSVCLVIIILAVTFIKTYPKFVLKAENIAPFESSLNLELGNEIPIKKGEKLIAESNGKQLYLDTDFLTIRVLDTKTGQEWTSKVDNPGNAKEKSIVNISYFGKNDKKVEWDAHTLVIGKDNFSIQKIKNGARINLNFETDAKLPEQIVPLYIDNELYEKRFIKPLEEAKATNKISDKEYSSYKTILSSVYTKELSGKGYRLYSTGISPSGAKKLISFAQAIGYTSELLAEDSEKMGLDVSIPQNPSFKVVLDITLDNGDLVVNVPTYETISGNDLFYLTSIEVLPTFGHATSAKVDEGYIFVPDGAGALFELNSYNSSYPHYQRPIYNNTYFDKLYEMDTFKENMSMPVFGIMYGKDKNASGMFAIIEQGEELGYINAQLGTKDPSTGGGVNNKVFSSVDIAQYSRVKLQGPYSEDSTRYLSSIGNIDMDYTVRYKFLTENATYDNFADIYKKYLIDKYNLETKYSNEAKMYFEVVSSLTLKERIAGIPYNKIISMTTYEELKKIAEELGDMNAIFEYDGSFNQGEKTTLMNNVKLTSQNGSEKDLLNLIEEFKNNSKELILGTNLTTIKQDNLAFEPKIHSIIGYDSKPVQIYKYNLTDGKFSPNKTDSRFILNPKYLKSVMDNFIAKTEKFDNIAILDIPNTFYGNYDVKNVITPIQANAVIERELQRLSEVKKLTFKNPNMNTVPYADIATNISRESSNYGLMFTSIPFRQLVLNGLLEYTTLNINTSKKDLDYYLLQAVELGSYPKFAISYKKEDILKDSEYTNLFNLHFETLKPRIEKLYNDYQEAFNQIGTTEIKEHRVLQDDVFETTYANGVKVITNYSLKSVKLDNDILLDSMGYKIIK